MISPCTSGTGQSWDLLTRRTRTGSFHCRSFVEIGIRVSFRSDGLRDAGRDYGYRLLADSPPLVKFESRINLPSVSPQGLVSASLLSPIAYQSSKNRRLTPG